MRITQKHIENIVIFLLVAMSGFPLFITGKEGTIFVFTVFLILALVYGKTDILKNVKTFRFALLFLILSFIQLLVMGQYDTLSFTGLLMRVGIGLLAVPFLSSRFYELYANLIYKLSIISLVLYFLFYLVPPLYDFVSITLTPLFSKANSARGYEYIPNILIYVFNQNDPRAGSFFDYRNTGPFWEPGALGLFTILALFINIFFLDDKFLSKKNIVLMITVVTTFSTTNYFALVLLIIGFAIFKTKRIGALGGVLAVGILISFSFLYESLPFLQEKINQRNTSYEDAMKKDIKQDRIGTFYVDMNHLLKNPLTGYGFDPANRIANFHEWDIDLVHKNNGVSDIFLILGIPFGLYYLVRIVNNAKFFSVIHNYPTYLFRFYFFALLMLIGFSEIIFIQVLFFFLSFLPDTLKVNYNPRVHES